MLPSAPAELAWVLDLTLSREPYSEPALAELDATLLPGVASRRTPLRQAFAGLWDDGITGCPELIPLAAAVGALLEPGLHGLLAGLGSADASAFANAPLLSEAPPQRLTIQARLRRLGADMAARHRYIELINGLWELLNAPWHHTGLAEVRSACLDWERRIATGAGVHELVPPRHPLARVYDFDFDDLLTARMVYVLSPLYFCTSGGHVADAADYVHIGVPASALLPSRRATDAAFVASRIRVLAEPTRVRLLLQLLAGPAGVMELARAQGLPQATVSGHVKALSQAGLLVKRKQGARTVYTASLQRIERLLEESRATLARWA